MGEDTHPVELLRKRNPDLFAAPDFWRTSNEHVEDAAAQSGEGVCTTIGVSAGGIPIRAFSYGAFEPTSPTTTISSAMASDRPGAFYDPATRSKPSLVLIGTIHGGETEGMALSMALVELLERGVDPLGIKRPALVEKLRAVRLTLVPCLNPDGRKAAAVAHLNGAELDDLFLVQQGMYPDGTLFRGRKIKEIQPVPEGMLRFRGGYYNARGVNLQHDDFFGGNVAPESRAIADLFRREVPDAFLTMHAHASHAAFLVPDAFLSPGMQRKQVEAAAFILAQLHARGIPFIPPDRIVVPPWSFYLQTWLHHMSGATPLLFEFCHGLRQFPRPLEEILETGLVVMEGWLDYVLTFGARPKSNELFGQISPA